MENNKTFFTDSKKIRILAFFPAIILMMFRGKFIESPFINLITNSMGLTPQDFILFFSIFPLCFLGKKVSIVVILLFLQYLLFLR